MHLWGTQGRDYYCSIASYRSRCFRLFFQLTTFNSCEFAYFTYFNISCSDRFAWLSSSFSICNFFNFNPAILCSASFLSSIRLSNSLSVSIFFSILKVSPTQSMASPFINCLTHSVSRSTLTRCTLSSPQTCLPTPSRYPSCCLTRHPMAALPCSSSQSRRWQKSRRRDIRQRHHLWIFAADFYWWMGRAAFGLGFREFLARVFEKRLEYVRLSCRSVVENYYSVRLDAQKLILPISYLLVLQQYQPTQIQYNCPPQYNYHKMHQQQPLSEDNLLPIYLIQDKLQSNFKKINAHILQASQHHSSIISDIALLRNEQYTMKNSFALRMQEMEKKIVGEIGMELEGRIAIAIGKSIDSLMGKMEQRDRNMGDVKEEFQSKLKKMKEELKYEVAVDNQKYFIKETKKLQDNLKRQFNSSSSTTSAAPSRKKSTNNPDPNPSLHPQQPSPENPGKWQQQHHQITSLESRIISLQEFSVNVDKRMYNGLTSIKESWKELGAQLLENKKNMIKKFDELRIDFIKLKGLKEFSIAPDKIEDEFKRKLNEKFTDIYQLLSITLTKNEYESSYERITQKLSRHDDDFIEMRKELATNNQFFTFYANNANQDDLKKDIGELFARVEEDRREIQDGFEKVNQKINGNYASISDIERDIRKVKDNFDVKVKLIDSMNQLVNSVKDRIQNLQDFNRFGPDKLQKIHNALDIDFTATQRQLIDAKSKKQNLNNVEQSQRELRIEMNKMKDQMFLLASQNQVKDQELLQMKKNYKELELKIQKFKGESEQAMASRKPWVCLSCDKQEKEKQQVKKQSKIKRPQPFKGFPQQRSQKVLKPPTTPPYEQRFEVYDKFREKYLSDTIKLPQIFREKLKDKDTSIQN